MRAAHYATPTHLEPAETREMTLLALIQEICDQSDDDSAVVATVCHLLRSGRVRLCGNFRDMEAEIFRGADWVRPDESSRSNRQPG